MALVVAEQGGNEEALRMDEETLETGHELAGVLKALERYPEALVMYKKIHSGRKSALGEDDPDTLDTLYEMGELHFREKRWTEAVKLLQDVYKGRKRVLGKKDAETLER
jgi:tetratricopeptide (TPR) repeat protein